MAQASGGTAGSSRSQGDGGMSGNSPGGKGQGNGGLGGSTGNGGGQSSSNSASSNTTNSASSNAKSAAAVSGSEGKQTGNIMGGLMSSVQSARDSMQGAVKSAFGGANVSGQSMGTGVTGHDNSTKGSVANAVGAMNTPAAQEKAGQMTKAFDAGYRNAAESGVTQSAFGVAGLPGAAVGKAVGMATDDTMGMTGDDASAAKAGAALAGQEGLGAMSKGLTSLAAGLLGGPVAAAIANMALGGVSYGMQRAAHPSAFSGQPSAPSGPVSGPSAINGVSGNGGPDEKSAGGMSTAMTAPSTQQPTGFQAASDYDRGSYQNLNLGSII